MLKIAACFLFIDGANKRRLHDDNAPAADACHLRGKNPPDGANCPYCNTHWFEAPKIWVLMALSVKANSHRASA